MIAYTFPDLDFWSGEGAHAGYQRIAPAGPWVKVNATPQGTTFLRDAKAFAPDAYNPPRPTADGGLYYGPKVLPPPKALRRECAGTQEVTTAGGLKLDVRVAYLSPRQIGWAPGGAIHMGNLRDSWAFDALALWNSAEKDPDGTIRITLDPVRVGRVVFGAVRSCYRVTEELLEDLGWIASEDLLTCLFGVWGIDPKALRAAGPISGQSAPESCGGPDSRATSGTVSPAGGSIQDGRPHG